MELESATLAYPAADMVEETFRSAFEHAPIGMAIVGLDHRWVKVNHALCHLVGHSEADLLQLTFADITHPDDLQADLALAAQLLAGDIDRYQMEKRYLTGTGDTRWVLLSVSLVRRPTGEPVHYVSQILDIDERKREEERLSDLADRDPLTGLWNRRRFERELERCAGQSTPLQPGGAVIVLDLDGFKAVNDTFGHETGDRLLVQLAGVMLEQVRGTDTVARLGGDEFGIVLQGASLGMATKIASRIEHAVVMAAARATGMCVSASAGVAALGPDSGAVAVATADAVMYERKRRRALR